MKELKMAVVGVRSFGARHARAVYNGKNTRLMKVCDIEEEYAKKIAEELSVPYCTDFEEILNDKEIEAVSLAVPDQLHVEMSIKALKAGKHVLCEKPLALELSECKKMVAEAKKYDKKMMVGQICRYTPSFVKAKKLVDSGEIGKLFFVESEYAHDYVGIDTPWRLDKKRHGVIGGACHAIDLLRWIAGDVTEVSAFSNHFMLPDWPTDDCTVAIMKYESGCIGKVFCSTGCKRKYTMRTVLYGTEGTIIVDNKSDTMTLFKNVIEDGENIYGERCKDLEIKIPTEVNNHNVELEIDEFANTVLNDLPLEIDAREGAKTVAIAEAIVNAAAENTIKKVDYDF